MDAELQKRFDEADFFGGWLQYFTTKKDLAGSAFSMEISERDWNIPEQVKGEGSDCWGEFEFDMRRTPQEVLFQKKYTPEWIKQRAFAGAISYELRRLSAGYEKYFGGHWSLFDNDLQRIITGPACMVDLNESREIGMGNLAQELFEFCATIKYTDKIARGIIEGTN